MADPALKTDPFAELGNSGLKQYGGWVREEFLPQLQGRQATRVYREMTDNDPSVGSVLFAIQQSLRGVDWRITPASSSSEAQKATEFVGSLTHDMSHTWEDFLSEALSMLTYGFAPMEVVYKRRQGADVPEGTPASKFDDGLIGIRKIALRGQDTVMHWSFDEAGGIQSLTQMPWTGRPVTIPIEKFLLFRTTSIKNNPEGRSLLRNAYRSWYFKKKIEEVEGIGIERDLAGLPVIYLDPALIAAAQTDAGAAMALESYKNIVRNLRRDEQEGVVLPSVYDGNGHKLVELTLLNAGGRRNFDTTGIIQRYDQRIAMTVLADLIFLGHTNHGTQALSNNKVDMFYAAIKGLLDGIAAVLNRYLLPRLWKLNGFDPATMPEFAPELPRQTDLAALGGYITQLVGAGMKMFPDGDLESFLRRAAGLPDPGGDDVAEVVAKYSPDQARDDHGRWSSGGISIVPNLPDFIGHKKGGVWTDPKGLYPGECVSLPKLGIPNMPPTGQWKPGERLSPDDSSLNPGTVIATFPDGKHYHGHVGIFVEFKRDRGRIIGIVIFEQWAERGPPKLRPNQPARIHFYPFDHSKSGSEDAHNYYPVIIPGAGE